jgi:hypothetical protein
LSTGAQAGYNLTGWGVNDGYLFENFDWGVPGDIVGVSTTLSNIIWANEATELSFTTNSISLLLGTMEIGEIVGADDIGILTLDITFRENQQPPAIPEPSTFVLMAFGLGGLLALRKRSINRSKE